MTSGQNPRANVAFRMCSLEISLQPPKVGPVWSKVASWQQWIVGVTGVLFASPWKVGLRVDGDEVDWTNVEAVQATVRTVSLHASMQLCKHAIPNVPVPHIGHAV
jgi:hypothetical protein